MAADPIPRQSRHAALNSAELLGQPEPLGTAAGPCWQNRELQAEPLGQNCLGQPSDWCLPEPDWTGSLISAPPQRPEECAWPLTRGPRRRHGSGREAVLWHPAGSDQVRPR